MTTYRIAPYQTDRGVKMYLQFKDTDTVRYREGWLGWLGIGKQVGKRIEVWRFIPKETYAYTIGSPLSPGLAPVDLPHWEEHRFLRSYHGQEWELRRFVEANPDIEPYFDYLRKKRVEYLEKLAAAEKAETIYFN